MTAAINHLLGESYFSICKVDALMDIVGTSRNREAYRLLRPLHFVHYADMPPELRDRIPYLLNECLRDTQAEQPATTVAMEGVAL